MQDSLPETPIRLSPEEANALRYELFLFGLPNASFATLFMTQLRDLRDGRIFDIHEVVEEIRALEGDDRGSTTKQEQQFSRPPLKGLWHKHFFNARFMAKNLALEWGVAPGQGVKLERMLSEEFSREESGVLTQELINRISYRLVQEAYSNRSAGSRPTGEWIVYAKHAGRRFYLTVGTHLEGDQVIYDRILRWCRPEFPFLFGDADA